MKYTINSQTKIVCLVAIGMIFSLLPVSSLFAQNQNSAVSVSNKNTNQTLFSSVGGWISSLLSSEILTPIPTLIITDIHASVRKNEVLIIWNASNLAKGRIYYSTMSPVTLGSSTLSVAASEYGNYANSKANVRYLNASTTYFFKILLQDPYGKSVISEESSFTTTP